VDEEPRNVESGRLSRRDLIRRGAIVGGSLLWVAPAIQSLTPAAHAQTVGSPTFNCCECRSGASGAVKCTGVGGLECVDPNSNPTAVASASACQSYCASLNKSYCFHSGATPLSCTPISQGNTLLACAGA
jgi:hypothetical protein